MNLAKLENKLEKASKNMVEKELKRMKATMDAAEMKTGPSANFRTSSDFTPGEVEDAVRQKIFKIREKIKGIIIATVKKIEDRHDFSIKINGDELVMMSESKRNEWNQLFDSTKETNVSIESIVMAVKAFLKINDSLIETAEKEENLKKKRTMYATQAVLVYELSSIIIEMLDSVLNTGGIEKLRNLYHERMKEIDEKEMRIRQYYRWYKDSSRKMSDGWLNALEGIRNAWESEVRSILKDQENWIVAWKNQRKTFERICREASIQLDVLEETFIAHKVVESMKSLKEVVEIKDIPLLHLDKELALTLIGGAQTAGGETEDESAALTP